MNQEQQEWNPIRLNLGRCWNHLAELIKGSSVTEFTAFAQFSRPLSAKVIKRRFVALRLFRLAAFVDASFLLERVGREPCRLFSHRRRNFGDDDDDDVNVDAAAVKFKSISHLRRTTLPSLLSLLLLSLLLSWSFLPPLSRSFLPSSAHSSVPLFLALTSKPENEKKKHLFRNEKSFLGRESD